MSYRYLWDWDFGNKVHGKIENSGIFKNTWAALTNDNDYIQVYGYHIKFPVIFFGILIQFILIFKRKLIQQAASLYVISIIVYGVSMYIFLASFDRHTMNINLQIGSFLFFALMIIGIIKETVRIKK
ncbi:hypothetical protein [Kordia sp. SMS9]|uniref:hypothetical protein n=1 Tax=Kordia sp. SMS9 TaxID=2282170 RepID=UPI0013B46C83|nr:hypothetical protein [Kordia sp. SMS9]